MNRHSRHAGSIPVARYSFLAQQRDVAAFAPAIVEYLRARYLWTDDVGDIAIYVRF